MTVKKYAPIESATCLNFTNLVGKIKRGIKNKNPDLKGEDLNKAIEENLNQFKINDQQFEYTFSENYYGGLRWYIRCPECKSPCLKLFLPTTYKDRKQLYLCKNCHNLRNSSLLMGSSRQYTKVIRPLKQLERIRVQLLKKSMTPEKAQPLLDEYKRIEDALAASPEYRLWKFQKEHGMA